ncbi:hypothetical protein FOZ60_008499 [Perkinsus olseni]|uniref:Uncharacterized protein n=1 Tax=Perkinsus olseni TaxID=32597 RepID=A0A7J6PFV2_PEROL|nr:hypothetical protein FOZ60_008499 [Perkinsus olseni]
MRNVCDVECEVAFAGEVLQAADTRVCDQRGNQGGIIGLVVEYNVAIVVTRVRFSDDAVFGRVFTSPHPSGQSWGRRGYVGKKADYSKRVVTGIHLSAAA